MADLLFTSLSGLLAYRRTLDTIGHNISNATTEGYSRQRIELSSRPSQPMGYGFVGNGVQIGSVERVYDQYLTSEVWSGVAANSRYQTYYGLASRVNDMLADASVGLAPTLEDFFKSVHGVATDPTDYAARHVMLSEAESLVDRFHHLDQRLSDLRRDLNSQLRESISEVNALAASIAQLNQDVAYALGSGNGKPPNDLLDQRDTLIKKLAVFVDVTAIEQDDGSLNILIGKGQTLVLGFQAGSLSMDNGNPPEISYNLASGNSVPVTNSLTGGKIGGMQEFRTQLLDPTQEGLGRVAIGLGTAFNAQHAAGMDQDGRLGGDFFRVPGPEVMTSSAAELSVGIVDASAFKAGDYQVDYDGSDWTLTRLSDGYTETNATGSFALDGLHIALASGSAPPAAGDTFQIRTPDPRSGAATIEVVITNTREIAAAAPIRTRTDYANAGSATITEGEVLDASNPNLLTSVTIQFIDSTTYTTDGGVTLLPYTSGGNIDVNGWRVRITGVPQAGDEFTVEKNVAGVGDGRNASLLADLQAAKTMVGGTTDFQGAYGQVVADAGTKTRQAEISWSAQEKRLQQAEDARASVSGVNLDEEAANLIRYQQAYQAAAQGVAVANSLFQILLDSFR